MRVLLVLLALVVTPFVAGVAQGKVKRDKTAEHCAKRLAKLAKRGDKKIKEKDILNCVEPPPPPLPPPAACAPSAPGTGAGTVTGDVYLDADPWSGLSSWCIKLIGAVTATAVTDIYGSYSFTGVPAGTYTVCETLQSGWSESFPTAGFGGPCPTGYGWTVTLADGALSEFNNFGNLPAAP
jgi:hypothetical protein